MNIEKYIDKHVSGVLEAEPFKKWVVERSVEDGLEDQIIHYVFQGRGVELRCDSDDKVSVIFLDNDELGDMDEVFVGISFSFSREDVIGHLGKPSKSGGKTSDPDLGEYGAWDRFLRSGYTIHVGYSYDADKIKEITLIRNDVVPD